MRPAAYSLHTQYVEANAGLDYSPYSNGLWTQTTLSEGIANGSLSQARLDDMVVRTVLPYYFVGLGTADLPAQDSDYTAWRNVRGNHSSLIRKNRLLVDCAAKEQQRQRGRPALEQATFALSVWVSCWSCCWRYVLESSSSQLLQLRLLTLAMQALTLPGLLEVLAPTFSRAISRPAAARENSRCRT